MQTKLADRPTIGYFKKAFGAIDAKIDCVYDVINSH